MHSFYNRKQPPHKKNTCRRVQGYQMIQPTSFHPNELKELDKNNSQQHKPSQI